MYLFLSKTKDFEAVPRGLNIIVFSSYVFLSSVLRFLRYSAWVGLGAQHATILGASRAEGALRNNRALVYQDLCFPLYTSLVLLLERKAFVSS